jgi:hypothetical protein
MNSKLKGLLYCSLSLLLIGIGTSKVYGGQLMKISLKNEVPTHSLTQDVTSEFVKESEAPSKREIMEPVPPSAGDLSIFARYNSELMKDPEYVEAERYAATLDAAAVTNQAASNNSGTSNLTLEELTQALDQSNNRIIEEAEQEEELKAQQEVSSPEVEIHDDD